MSTPYPIPVTAAQVGTYFVGQYYQLLQQQPEYAYQFYSDASTMLRIDGSSRENATTMLVSLSLSLSLSLIYLRVFVCSKVHILSKSQRQIHALIMSLNYAGIEIRTAHSLESWNGGVLVMVSGSVQMKDFTRRRKFVETFFLAPQEKGYFVLSDVFHFIDEEQIHHHLAVLLARNNLESKLNAPNAIPELVPNYLLGGEIQARELVTSAEAKENGPVDSYGFSEQQLQQVPDTENVREESSADTNGSLQNTVNTAQHQLAVEETTGESQKHTYASILQVAKGQSVPSVASQTSFSKNVTPAPEWDHAPQPIAEQATVASDSFERSGSETVLEISAVEDEDEIRSVYVRNLPTTVSEAEIEEEFEKFGKISPDGVVIRSRKDVGVCYAFVEFEDMTGVHTAVKAGTAHVAGRQVYIEERRPNSNIPSRAGRGRGRGRGSYPTDAPGGRFGGQSFGRGGSYDGGDRDYNRSRGNGYYRPSPRQGRGFIGNQLLRNGQNQSE